jgi:phosphatidylinositol alpha-1,6-mannosyltransferase
LGVGGCLRFTGSLPAGVAVRHELDAADLFVLPSRTEGMPRALLEAMARGLPCVATMVGGVPDVLPSSHLAAPGDEVALAGLILEACRSPRVMDRMSAENWKRAKDFCADTLYPKWDRFFVDLLDRTRSYYRTAAASAMCEAA